MHKTSVRYHQVVYPYYEFWAPFLGFRRPGHKPARSSSLVAKSYPILATPWTVACQAPLSMGFSSIEHWSGLPFPSPIKPARLAQTQSLFACFAPFEPHSAHN